MGSRGAAGAIALATAVLLVAGCGLLYPPFPIDEPFPSEETVTTYRTGTATIELGDGTVIDLTFEPGGSINSFMGSDLRWSNPDGWYLTITGAGLEPEPFGESGFLTLDRIADGRHWRTFDPTACALDVDFADDSGFSGAASCDGLRWADLLASGSEFEPDPIDGEPAFDAELTFGALP